MKVLALSSSRVGNSGYLEEAAPLFEKFLGSSVSKIAFVPFASANNDYNNYVEMVRKGLNNLPYNISLVTPGNAKSIIEEADAIMIGGGNTFKLLHDVYELKLLQVIQHKVNAGTPYVGWSAGANITGLTIGTTNDMPIIEPESFKAFGFLPFQINPHYRNEVIRGHNGETRDQRLNEFLEVNKAIKIIGLPEGTALQLSGGTLEFMGISSGVLFQYEGEEKIKKEITPSSNLTYLIS